MAFEPPSSTALSTTAAANAPSLTVAPSSNTLPPSPPASTLSTTSGFNYPFAAAPDIIRSNQKDAYYQGVLLEQLSTILRKIYGARILHKYSLETKTFTDLLYLSLTTLRNARTLGEEYCDILHVESSTSKLPALRCRLGFILTTILVPYFMTKSLPPLRSRLRQKLQSSLSAQQSDLKPSTYTATIKTYLLENLDALTSSENLLAVHLGLFYFTGAYYHLSKRIWGIRYIFTKRLLPHEQRVGYEVLGLLLLAQLVTQGCFHVSSTFSRPSAVTQEEERVNPLTNGMSRGFAANPDTHASDACQGGPKYDLKDEKVMRFMSGDSGRKCTLCLESMKDPTATGCGHVFCWSCISEWCRSKPECPLCRQSTLVQHLLPLRC
ncbi:Pex12 amino terminal region-domain-containing protein [Tuber brumale]|nr:Pex12 amino terminal region-domain-containing protein [Tuber brumale]